MKHKTEKQQTYRVKNKHQLKSEINIENKKLSFQLFFFFQELWILSSDFSFIPINVLGLHIADYLHPGILFHLYLLPYMENLNIIWGRLATTQTGGGSLFACNASAMIFINLFSNPSKLCIVDIFIVV